VPDRSSDPVIRLDGELVLRRAGAADRDGVVALTTRVLEIEDPSSIRALLAGEVPVEWLMVAAGPGAERPGGGTPVSACVRIPHGFAIDGVGVPGSQIEYVATDEQWRDRGLVRALFDEHHRRAAAGGEVLQVVGGIPYFYRKLGYGHGLDVAPTIAIAPRSAPPLDTTRVEVRPARRDDLDWFLEVEVERPRDGVTIVRDRASISTWLARTDAGERTPWESLLVAEVAGRPVGWVRTSAFPDQAQLFLLPGVAPDTEVAGQLLVAAIAVGQRLADELGRPVDLLATDQPGTPWSRVVHAAGHPYPEPSGYFARVADPVAFLRSIEPVLSRRLTSSGLVADRGELSISLYERGVLLTWERGQVTRIEAADPDPEPFESRGVGVAPDWFPALVLGRWGASGLAERTDDTELGDHTTVMDVLFPALPNDLVTDL
jgi:hypothetical protein